MIPSNHWCLPETSNHSSHHRANRQTSSLRAKERVEQAETFHRSKQKGRHPNGETETGDGGGKKAGRELPPASWTWLPLAAAAARSPSASSAVGRKHAPRARRPRATAAQHPHRRFPEGISLCCRPAQARWSTAYRPILTARCASLFPPLAVLLSPSKSPAGQ
jgi:hypothetical protein